jgi:ankyrin repeat protein
LGENINDQSQQSQTSSTQMLNNFSTDQHTLISIAKILIKEGANVNEQNKAKMSPLHIAV